ncbi:conserved hypothetical protein [Leishmania infantum JPCM5]|uniref:C2_domain_containing_protein_-_putative n=2 Tax=Leishmania infantum TaxID=5671 RepID=A0A6L0XRC8_LEIIN|nr:conserved hypothetical protein [Leishmania infantum JPCM5]CAC9539317.1 C2_domain_containing_protein_-_putative [Leishmania infantum]CAM71686.2 conserved hypothetical protein [Leishmania infantum JPCM5]SUZ45620.1 C2_domain_containing_protein_-_putative [Leishmania infantum]|eukprot:XP_001468599.2 conserved hypothetical protein [Leishmania infantum JPCM5]
MSRIASGDSVKLLKGQLSEKEFRIGELENRVKDLFNEAKELDEKLRIANRNARVLEEENSNYHIRIKNFEKDGGALDIFPLQKEAMKLIQENDELRQSLTEAERRVREISGRERDSDHDADKRIRELQSECERMRKERLREYKELESTRRLCADLQKRLDDDEETLKSAKELWDQERDRYQQKIDELLDFNKRAERPLVTRTAWHRDGPADEPLEQFLLKEEVAQLERTLKEVQHKNWEKEKTWVRTETELRHHINELQVSGRSESRNDNALFQAMKDQVRALQDEIQALRSDRRGSRSAQGAPMSSMSTSSTVTPAVKSGVVEEWAARYESVSRENDNLRDQVDAAKAKILELQNLVDEKVVACKEMELRLAAAQKQRAIASQAPLVDRPSSIRSTSERSYESRATGAPRSQDDARAMMVMRQRVLDLEAELRTLCSAHEQKETISHARLKDYKKQIVELLRENANLRDASMDQADTEGGCTIMDFSDGMMRLTKDKRESVEEVMRLLELAWDSEDELNRQLRRAKYQNAAMAAQGASKDDEIQCLQKSVSILESKLRDMEKRAHDNGDLKDAMGELRKQRRGLTDENDKLRKKIGDLEKAKEEVVRQQSAKQNDAKRRIEELQTEIDDLTHKLANARKAGSRPVSPRLSTRSPQPGALSPRPSARRRTPEAAALSHLSVRSTDEQRRSAVPEGAHLAFTVVELTDVLRNGRPITEAGHVIIKVKSIKEKYKTSVKLLSSVIRFDETFVFYLAQPDQDVITLHVFYKPHGGSREFHIGDACFSMATLYRGLPRQRIAPVVQSPGTKEARRAAQVEVHLQTDDFGKTMVHTQEEVEKEKMRFIELVNKFEKGSPEMLHAVDVYMASNELQ